jgi:polyhydroxybutyrate depolymerase
VIILSGIIFLLNAPLFRLAMYRENGLHRKAIHHAPTPAQIHLAVTPTQNEKTILDQQVTSTGCGKAIHFTPGMTVSIPITSENKERSYLLYLPIHYSNLNPHPLILDFHGYASNAREQEGLSKFNPIADTNNIILIYPQGTTGTLAARGWNTGVHPTITTDDVLFVSNILNQIQSNFCVNPTQIYATGFSNGGGLTGKLACNLSNRIAAFAPISGSYLTSYLSCSAKRPVPIIEFHGTADNIVPYDGIPALKEISTQLWLTYWAKKDGCTDTPDVAKESDHITKYTWVGCTDNSTVIHYQISGGHHVWPGMFEDTINGEKTYVNAAQIIWDFFQKHTLDTKSI